jgi:hypothetical protein
MNISIQIAVALLLTSSMLARDRSNACSMVVTAYGIMATSHVRASVARAQILAISPSFRSLRLDTRLRWVSARILMHRELIVDLSRRGRARLFRR